MNNLSNLNSNKEQITLFAVSISKTNAQENSTTNNDSSSGIKGTVFLEGAGGREPYSGYKIEVFTEKDNKIPISSNITDKQGNYVISLKPGSYIIYTQEGPSIYKIMKANNILVNKNQFTNMDIIIDTGIRSLQ